MENKSLVSLSMDMARMAAELVDMGGELTPEMEDLLNLTEGDLKTKVDRYKLFSDALDANSLYLKDLEVQFKRGREAAENRIESMKATVKFAMETLNVDVLEGTAWLYKRSEIKSKLVFTDVALVPDKYWVLPPPPPPPNKVIDKETLTADLALGVKLPGVTLEKNYMVRSYVNKPGKARPVKEASK